MLARALGHPSDGATAALGNTSNPSVPVPNPKRVPKPRRKKGDDAPPAGDDSTPPPVTPKTPLEKARALASSASLGPITKGFVFSWWRNKNHNLKQTVGFLQQMSLSVKVRLKEAEEAAHYAFRSRGWSAARTW